MFLPPYEKLDHDRLWNVVERIRKGETIYRGEGETVARIYLMFGEVEMGDPENRYLYVGENTLCAKWVARDFLSLVHRVFPEMENSVGWFGTQERYPDTIVLPHKQVYRFVSVDSLVDRVQYLHGHRFHKVFFDVSTDKQYALDAKNTNLMDVLDYLEETGAEFV